MNSTAMTVTASNTGLMWTSGDWPNLNSSAGYCYSCNCWPCSCLHHNYWYPVPQIAQYVYTVRDPDKASLLKAWLDGFMTDRKLDEKAMKIVRKKLEEFCDRS